jgi:Coenzyme PQQ synthesis protein D (PqqD)
VPTRPGEWHPCRIGVAPFGDGAVLHDSRTARLFQLNHTAACVWRSLRAGGLEEVIVDELALAHGLAHAVVRRDLRAFVDALHAAGLSWRREAFDGHDADEEVRLPVGPPALVAVYQVGELALRVMCYPDDVAAAFVPLAAPARVPDDAACEGCLALFRDRGTFALTRDDRVVERLDTAPAARWALVRQLVSTAGRGPCLALLHAGAITTPAGCLLICGESGAGKSTLLAGLIHGGFAFVADDIGAIRRRYQACLARAVGHQHQTGQLVGRRSSLPGTSERANGPVRRSNDAVCLAVRRGPGERRKRLSRRCGIVRAVCQRGAGRVEPARPGPFTRSARGWGQRFAVYGERPDGFSGLVEGGARISVVLRPA